MSPLDRFAGAGLDRGISLTLFVVVLGSYAYFFNGGGWNQNSHFDLTRAIVERHTFAIDTFAANTGDVSRIAGHVYSNKSPGISLLAVAPYAVLVAIERAAGAQPTGIRMLTMNAWLCTVAVCALLGALVPVALYRHAMFAFGLSRRWSAAIALIAALGTPLLPYATMLYLHVPSAALLLLAFVAAEREDGRGPIATAWLISLAAVTNYLCLPLVPLLIGRSVRHASDRRRAAILAAASSVAPLATLALYQHVAFGSVFRTSFHGVADQFVSADRFIGILGAPSLEAAWGITFSPYRGLFYASPVLLLAIGGAIRAWRHRARLGELAFVGVVVFVFAAFNICFNGWSGGWGFGPRYLIPIVPLLVIASMHLATKARRLWIGLGTVSVAITVMATAVNPQPPQVVIDPLGDYIAPLFMNGHLEPSASDQPWATMAGHVSVNRETIDESWAFEKFPPGSAPQEWASFNLGEFVFGAGELASLLPLLVWLIGGAVVLTAQTAERNAHTSGLRSQVASDPEARARASGCSSWWRQLPKPVLVAVTVAWGVRAVLLCYAAPVTDEYLAIRAASLPVTSQFFASADSAERWRIVRQLTTGDRPLWAVSNLLWGWLFPSSGGAAYPLALAAALLAALALTGAAQRISGDETAQLVLVVASLSPLLLYFSANVMAPALCTMWVCLALFFLSSPRWRAADWAAGGLCLGLAFGTHMGAGAPALGLAMALGISAVVAARKRGLSVREKLHRFVLAPLVGAAAAVAPIAAIAAWARTAGESYFRRLIHHENFGFANLGPRGLWLRHLFELDPMLEIIVIVTALSVVLGGVATRRHRAFVGAGVLVLAGLLAASFRGATSRAWVSVLAFAAIPVLAWLTGVFRRPTDNSQSYTPTSRSRQLPVPITLQTLTLAAGFIAILFTIWRPISAMPRLVFPTWPLFVLVLLGSARKVVQVPIRTWVVPLTAMGCVILTLVMSSMIRLRSIPARSESFAIAHPGWQRLRYEDFWRYDDRMRIGGWLATRSDFDIEVVSGYVDLYPVAVYEEEPYKIELMTEMVRDFGLGGVLSGEEIPWSDIFFKPRSADPSLPVAATPPR